MLQKILTIRPTLLSLVILLGAPLVILFSLSSFTNPQKDIIKGEWQLSFEKSFDEHLSFRNFALSFWGVAQYAVFQEGKKGVLVGQDGWLYTSEDFDYHPKALQEVARKLELIKRINTQLSAQNIKLIIALIPDKSRIYPEHLGRYTRPRYTHARYQSFWSSLQSLGVTAPDLSAAFEGTKADGQLFLRTDTHWTPRGASIAAQSLANAAPQLIRDLTFTTTDAGQGSHKGDLTKFLPLGSYYDAFGIPFDQMDLVKTMATDTGSSESADLLGDVAIAGALVGTSYSADERWNFIGALKQAFKADFINVAKDGQGPIVPMLAYLESDDFKNAPPQFIVWDIPERFLDVAYTLPENTLTKDLP